MYDTSTKCTTVRDVRQFVPFSRGTVYIPRERERSGALFIVNGSGMPWLSQSSGLRCVEILIKITLANVRASVLKRHFYLVMEVACGEHGECVHKLVMAVNNGKCVNYQLHQGAINAVQTVSNDIAKESPQQETKSETALIPNGVAKQPNGGTVINMPISCTTSLLDSAESIEQKVGFPTNSCTQFWILLKRIFLSQIRDMVSKINRPSVAPLHQSVLRSLTPKCFVAADINESKADFTYNRWISHRCNLL